MVKVFHALLGLCRDAFGHGTRCRVDGKLAGNEQHAVGRNGLAVRANGAWGVGGSDGFFHNASQIWISARKITFYLSIFITLQD